MYQDLPSDLSLPKLEKEILNFWEQEKIFRLSIEQRKTSKDFVFYDGPPGTNGQPHIGHMLQSSIKDLYPRYKTMQGYRVIRKAGWDTHGLPVELTAQRELKLGSKKEIEDYGIERFIEYCRKTVFRYKEEWITAIQRVGRFLDFEDEYASMNRSFIQTGWWVLKEAWKKQLLYKSYKVIAYCPKIGTSLSNQEVSLGYQEVEDMSVYAKFPIKKEMDTFFLAWTTTAFSLIGNTALALGPEIDYVKIAVDKEEKEGKKGYEEKYILAENRLSFLKEKSWLKNYKVLSRHKGKELANIDYEPLWDFFSGLETRQHYTIVDEYVSTEDGTGIVHLAMYGEDDWRLIKKYRLPIVQHVDLNGLFLESCGKYSGRSFDEKNIAYEIVQDLQSLNRLFAQETILHSYPFNYKTETRLLYYAKASWFIKTTAFKKQMISANQKIHWYPHHVRDGRFGKWLENNVDWALSRERYWGTPLPIWVCEECNQEICIGSWEELNSLSQKPLDPNMDLHIPDIDRVFLNCSKCGGTMKREPLVLDVWFDSGIMPWGQVKYPSEKNSKKWLETLYPADFICEGIDQTRGWFYSLLAVATLLTGDSSFRHVICTELVLDQKGQKMSKTKGNIIEPSQIFQKYGADPMRWLFLSTTLGRSIHFSEFHLESVIKKILLPLWNVYSFFITYAKIDHYVYSEDHSKSDSLLDRWIDSKSQKLIEETNTSLDNYDSASACQSIEAFLDDLSNWYVRRSRRRFWKSVNDLDKQSAYSTLYTVLLSLLKVSAPIIPFLTDSIYQNLVRSVQKKAPLSIHLCDFPKAKEKERDPILEKEMDQIRHWISKARSLRERCQIKVRQPIKEIIFISPHKKELWTIAQKFQNLIQEELNVKSIRFLEKPDELLILKAKPNLRELGPRLGSKLQKWTSAIQSLSSKEIQYWQDHQEIHITQNTETLTLKKNDLILEKEESSTFAVDSVKKFAMKETFTLKEKSSVEKTDRSVTQHSKQESEKQKEPSNMIVALNRILTEELIQEGLARELINKVQHMRKSQDLEVTDSIQIKYHGTSRLKQSVQAFQKQIQTETLAKEIQFVESPNGKNWTLNQEKSTIAIKKMK